MKISLGYSPCPNDTLIFYALTHNKIDTGKLVFRETLQDVETLNQLAIDNRLNITKVSVGAYPYLNEKYFMLSSGGAFGLGWGPLIVARETMEISELKEKTLAIPGKLTTAYLLLRLLDAEIRNIVPMPFNQIIDAVSLGKVDAGLIIHEGRFTYQKHGLNKIVDLGEWWKKETGLPLPLGSILAQRSLGRKTVRRIDDLIKESIRYGLANQEEAMSYIKENSQEIEDWVIDQYIDLYVDKYSIDMGEEGTLAVKEILERAQEAGITPKIRHPIFI